MEQPVRRPEGQAPVAGHGGGTVKPQQAEGQQPVTLKKRHQTPGNQNRTGTQNRKGIHHGDQGSPEQGVWDPQKQKTR